MFFSIFQFSPLLRAFVDKKPPQGRRFVITFRLQKLGLFVKWLHDEKLHDTKQWRRMTVDNVVSCFQNFIPLINLVQEQIDEYDVTSLMSLMTLENQPSGDSGVVKVKKEPPK